MVWPFSSSSSDKNDALSVASSVASSTKDTLETTSHDAKMLLQSTKESLQEITSDVEDFAAKAAIPNSKIGDTITSTINYIPESTRPYIITSAAFSMGILATFFYRRRLRRIPTSAYLTPSDLQGKRILKGKVTSVGDSDNFRFYHTPGGVWAGWGWLRHVPAETKELKNQTLHIRIAGVDAPEGAHFGMPAQPFSKESLQWLRNEILGKTVTVKPFAKDRYDRVNVSLEMLKVGYAQLYRQAGSEYGGMLDNFEKIEAHAKSRKIGIWSQSNMVSAAEHKKQYLRGEGKA
ncbi:putative endonuclease lcl3 [Haplosporangium sp. Z 27]|nr:putative endonuclease lcl3 [Haplosporangium sp. Z 27]